MWFLIGVLILIFFIIFCFQYIKIKFKQYFKMDLSTMLKNAEMEDETLPKSLSSMDSIYLEQIKRDFPEINIKELKRSCEKEILNLLYSIEQKDVSNLKGKIKSLAESLIEDNKKNKVEYNDIKIHNTVVSKYECKKGIATITFGCSFEYKKVINETTKKIQDRAKVEYIYIIDENQVSSNEKVLGINCPNCGAPLKSLGDKKCRYCTSPIAEIVKRVWNCNDITFY